MARQKKVKTCLRCGASPLYWANFDGSWVLAESDELGTTRHVCKASVGQAPPMVTTTNTSSMDSNLALYALVRAQVQTDIAQALEGLELSASPSTAPVIVTLPGQDTPHAVIDHAHHLVPRLIRMVSAGCHVRLVGPAGSGKTHAAEQVAEGLGLTFFPQSVGPHTSKTDLLGFVDAGGRYQASMLRQAYEHGGLYLLDEYDAGNPGVLTTLNAALANGYCSFPDGVIKRHENFRCVAAGNTYGQGASRVYIGRQVMDAATTDRFVDLPWDYDTDIERSIALSYNLGTDWIEFVHALRAAQAKTEIRAVVSTRVIIDGYKLLRAGFTQSEVEDARVWSRLGNDDAAKLRAAIGR